MAYWGYINYEKINYETKKCSCSVQAKYFNILNEENVVFSA